MFDFDLIPNFTKTTFVGIFLMILSCVYAFYLRPVFLAPMKGLVRGFVKFLDSLVIGIFIFGAYLTFALSFIEDFFNVTTEKAFIISLIIVITIVVGIYVHKRKKPTPESKPEPWF